VALLFDLLKKQHQHTRSPRVARVRSELSMGANGRIAWKSGGLRVKLSTTLPVRSRQLLLFYSGRATVARLSALSGMPRRRAAKHRPMPGSGPVEPPLLLPDTRAHWRSPIGGRGLRLQMTTDGEALRPPDRNRGLVYESGRTTSRSSRSRRPGWGRAGTSTIGRPGLPQESRSTRDRDVVPWGRLLAAARLDHLGVVPGRTRGTIFHPSVP
jgi:hypothetical protein